MPTPVRIIIFLALSECLCLISATASPEGVDDGCTTPFCVAVPVPAMSGMIASGGMLMAGGAVVVVVVDESFGFLSPLTAVVVVGAGAAVVGAWVPGEVAGGAVELGVGAGGGDVGEVVGGCVSGTVAGGVVVVVVGVTSTSTFTTPHMPPRRPFLSDPSPLVLEK